MKKKALKNKEAPVKKNPKSGVKPKSISTNTMKVRQVDKDLAKLRG